MWRMMKYLAKNRYRYFKHFLKTFAPILLILALLLGMWIFTSGHSFFLLLKTLPFEEYRFQVWIALTVLSIWIGCFGQRSGISIYHATIHFFYNTEYLTRFLFCIYCKKLIGAFLVGAVLAGLLTSTPFSFVCCAGSIASFLFIAEMLKWFRFNSKKKCWILLCVISGILFMLFQNLYAVVGAMGIAACFVYAKRMKINYTKWIDECAFVDEAAFASAKQDLPRMYHVQNLAKSKKVQSCSYPIWTLNRSNALIQKSLIRILRENKTVWIIWSVPLAAAIFAEIRWPEMPYINLIKAGTVCIFLSVMNQYLYKDFFEILNKSDKGFFLPYSSNELFAQGIAVPAMVFFTLALICKFLLKLSVIYASLLFLVWVLSFAALMLYRLKRGTPGKLILAVQNAVMAGMTVMLAL